MRHGKTINHLGRKSEHRKAMLANLAASLIIHKKIETTVAKAKALRRYVEPLITTAKNDSTHARRIVFGYLKYKQPVKELFDNVMDKIADRPGGYTRILKLGKRFGDNAEMCMIELVDFNETYSQKSDKKAAKKRTRRGSGSGTGAPATQSPAQKKAETPAPTAPVVEETHTQEVHDEAEKTEETETSGENAAEEKPE